jgi:hypothetical protein
VFLNVTVLEREDALIEAEADVHKLVELVEQETEGRCLINVCSYSPI